MTSLNAELGASIYTGIPYVTGAQRKALPLQKQVVYDTDLSCLCQCDGTSWFRMAYTAPLALTDSGPTAGLLYASNLMNFIDGGLAFPGGNIPTQADWNTLRDYIKAMFAADGATDSTWTKWLWATSVPNNVGDPLGFGTVVTPYISESNGGWIGVNPNLIYTMSRGGNVQDLGVNGSSFISTGYKGGWPVRLLWTGDQSAKTCTDTSGNVYDILTIGNQKWLAQYYRGLYWGNGTANPVTKVLAPNTRWSTLANDKMYCTWTNT